MKVIFPSVTFWYNDRYNISEIATSQSLLRFICSGRKFVKKLRLLFGLHLKEALETSSIVKETVTTNQYKFTLKKTYLSFEHFLSFSHKIFPEILLFRDR